MKSKEKCIAVDLDGTISINNSGRSYYDDSKYDEDDVNKEILNVITSLIEKHNYSLVVITGRMATEKGVKNTKKWLNDNGIIPACLYMRNNGDYRKDYVVKSELIKGIQKKYEIVYSFDDSNTSCKAYRDAGITCLQVAYDPGRIRKCCEKEKGNYCSTCGADLKYGR